MWLINLVCKNSEIVEALALLLIIHLVGKAA